MGGLVPTHGDAMIPNCEREHGISPRMWVLSILAGEGAASDADRYEALHDWRKVISCYERTRQVAGLAANHREPAPAAMIRPCQNSRTSRNTGRRESIQNPEMLL